MTTPMVKISLNPDDLQALLDAVETTDDSFDTQSRSTVSDLPGPGRTVDNIISKTGKGLERLLYKSSKRFRADDRRLLDNGIIEFTDGAQLHDFLEANFLEVQSASDGTASDLPGAGRTLGNIISKAGKKLEGLLGRASQRIGGGPSSTMDRTLVVVDHTWLPTFGPRRSQGHLRAPPSFQDLVKQAVSLASWSPSNPKDIVNNDKFVDCCRKLVKFLRHDKLTTQYLAISYISILLCICPQSHPLFLQLGAKEVVNDVVSQCAFFPARHQRPHLLLTPSRRALLILSHSQVLTTIKRFDEISSDETSSADTTISLVSALVEHTMGPETQLLATRRLTSAIISQRLLDDRASVANTLPSSILHYWSRLAHSTDPLYLNVFGALFGSLSFTFTRIERSVDVDNWLRVVISILRQGVSKDGDLDRDSPLFRLVCHVPPEPKFIAAGLVEQTRSELTTVLKLWQELELAPWQADALAPFTTIISPFFSLYGAFCREWYFIGPPRWFHDTLPLRAIPPRRRTKMCRSLLKMFLWSECSMEEIQQVAAQDEDCFHDILRILQTGAVYRDIDAERMAEFAWNMKGWYKERGQRGSYCVGIRRGTETNGGIYKVRAPVPFLGGRT
ncbi:hypothetical protein JAAARDRAFT_53221 [Jaapia argillacea MUCL 33604]|uniref:Uncharacterized protein n=1 Tax=Jaapia argillacea MUCL 33604 TaxID=933084 RepID=A0A067QA18_9AGAM|nr:hypothetical protein JAAARDRAFT_53221 [Jaapia argillacea MUCL 33604]